MGSIKGRIYVGYVGYEDEKTRIYVGYVGYEDELGWQNGKY